MRRIISVFTGKIINMNIVGIKNYVLLLCSVVLLLFPNPVMAQEVTVTGVGSDRDSAMRDAARHAVEQIVGTFIDSQTVMKNLVIQLDEVYKKSQGFVKHITVLEEGRLDLYVSGYTIVLSLGCECQ